MKVGPARRLAPEGLQPVSVIRRSKHLREERAYRDGLRRRVEENPPPIPPCSWLSSLSNAQLNAVEQLAAKNGSPTAMLHPRS